MLVSPGYPHTGSPSFTRVTSHSGLTTSWKAAPKAPRPQGYTLQSRGGEVRSPIGCPVPQPLLKGRCWKSKYRRTREPGTASRTACVVSVVKLFGFAMNVPPAYFSAYFSAKSGAATSPAKRM